MLASSPEVHKKETNKNVEIVSNDSICQADTLAVPLPDENGSDNKEHQSESEENSESETSSEVTKTNNDDSSSTEHLTDSYLADESSINVNSVTVSDLSTDDVNASECDHLSDRTSPSKSIPEISAENLTDTEDHEQISETEQNHLPVSKPDFIALNSRSTSRSTSAGSSTNTSLNQYEEFTSTEIAEAKQAVDLPVEHVPINPDLTTTPEPHSASPIKEVLLTLQKEASKYRNIQVIGLLHTLLNCYYYAIQ